MTGRCRQVVATIAAWLLPLGFPLVGQTSGSLGIAASVVEYDGFLVSGAAVLAPALRFDAQNLALGAQGSWTVFESGNQVLQGTAAAAWLSPARGWWRFELSGSAGLSKYAAEPASGNLLAGTRWHFFGRQSGGWVGANVGRTGDGLSAARVPVEIAVAGWSVWSRVTLVGTLTATWLGRDRYVDLLGAVRWSGARVEVEARAGARPWTVSPEGVGDPRVGVFGELSASMPVARRVALTVSGGSYASDPVRRVLAAKYATLGLRLGVIGRTAVAMPAIAGGPLRPRESSVDVSSARLEIGENGFARAVRIRVRGAQSVELMSDFTDWAIIPLARVGSDVWETRLPLTPGVYRVNVRIDGGRWLVPAGARVDQTEFGVAAGVVVVP